MKLTTQTTGRRGNGTYGFTALVSHHKDSFHHFFSVTLTLINFRLTVSWTTKNKTHEL